MLVVIAFALSFTAVTGTKSPLLVYPRVLEERSYDGRIQLHIHESLTLNLRKTSVAAPEFRVLEVENGEEVTKFYKGEDIEQHLYEDEKRMATVHVLPKGSSHEVEGVIGPDQRIQPMPSMERSADGVVAHAIFPIESKRMLDRTVVPSETEKTILSARNMAGNNVPESVIVEIFFVCDLQYHRHFNQTKYLLRYILVLLNSVQLRYAQTQHPRLQLRFTGLKKSTDDAFISGSGHYIHAQTTLENFRKYAVQKKKGHGYPDITYLLTGGDVYGSDTNVQGFSYVGGVCTDYFVGLGEDKAGYYSGIWTTAHEIAHVLGSEHDGDPPTNNIDGHPGALSCPWSRGYLMSYVRNNANRHRFSPCSLQQMQYVITLRGQACWNVTRQGKKRDGQYPGMEVSMEKLCKNVFPDKRNVTADLKSPSLQQCKVKCQYQEVGSYNYVTTYYQEVDALDYMYCGNKKVCIGGECVTKPQNY